MSNSSLVSYTKISPNRTSPRDHVIDTITIHCMAGQLSVETCGNVFAPASRNASSNYGIGPDGRIGMYVEEKDRSWASSNRANDMRAITIEVASDSKAPYAVTDAAYQSLIKLLVDICKRNNIKKLLWQGNKALIGNVAQQNMTVHRWFAAKACPGDYLYNKHSEIAAAVNKQLGASTVQPKDTTAAANPVGTSSNFQVRVTTSSLNIRSGPGTNYAQVGTVGKGTYTIVETYLNGTNTWGKLKSGAGWISLNEKYTQKIGTASTSTPATSATTAAKPATTAASTTTAAKVPSYTVGKIYTLQDEMNVRTGPGTNYAKKKHYQLTNDAQKHDLDKDGALDKGTQITCKEVRKVGNDIWIRCPSGWIAGYSGGTIYVK